MMNTMKYKIKIVLSLYLCCFVVFCYADFIEQIIRTQKQDKAISLITLVKVAQKQSSVSGVTTLSPNTSLAPPAHGLHQPAHAVLRHGIPLLMQGLNKHLSCCWPPPSCCNPPFLKVHSTDLCSIWWISAQGVGHPLQDFNSLQEVGGRCAK